MRINSLTGKLRERKMDWRIEGGFGGNYFLVIDDYKEKCLENRMKHMIQPLFFLAYREMAIE